MRACINQVTSLASPFEADIPAYARAGWDAVELWLTKLEAFLDGGRTLTEARSMLDGEGVRAVGAASQGGLLTARGPEGAAHWEHFRRRLDLMAALGVGTMVVTAEFAAAPGADDLDRLVASLAEAAELAGSSRVRLALEFQKGAAFCNCLETAVALVASTGSTNLGICLDLFHFHAGPSKLEDLGYLNVDNLAWVQVSDVGGVFRELATDSDRILPGEGDLPLDPIFDHLQRIGYDGYVSLEVLNPVLWRTPVDRLAEAGRESLRRALGDRERAGDGGA